MTTLRIREAVLRESKHTGSAWTFKCQGVAFDGEHWFFVSNKTHRVHQRKLDMSEEVAIVDLGVGDEPHLGAPCWYEGSLYVPVQGPQGVAIATRSSDGAWKTRFVPVSLPELDDYLACCAFNPFDGLLYTANFGADADVQEVVGFHVDGPADPTPIVRRIPLQVASRKVQGLAFTRNGHLLLSSDESDDIRFYRERDGEYLGSIPVEKGDCQEVQGLTVAEGVIVTDDAGSLVTQIHLVLDYWMPPTSIWLKHYGIPGADAL